MDLLITCLLLSFLNLVLDLFRLFAVHIMIELLLRDCSHGCCDGPNRPLYLMIGDCPLHHPILFI